MLGVAPNGRKVVNVLAEHRDLFGLNLVGVELQDPLEEPRELHRFQAQPGRPAELEKALHDPTPFPVLVIVGLAHAQFETIHPFLDGNGRMGRLLITFLLCEYHALREPLLYLSIFFKQHRQEYYDRLQAVRDHGDWEGWLSFFLAGVASVAREATDTARHVVQLRERLRDELPSKLGRRSGNGLRLLDALFRQPVVAVKSVEKLLSLSQPAALALVDAMVSAGVLEEITGLRRNRIFEFGEYLQLFTERKRRS